MAAVNDIMWHNASTGEIQLWLMNEHRVAGRATVLGENGQPALIGPPWSIVGCAGVGGDSYSNIFWHNSSTGEIQIWFLDRERCTARATVLGEDGTPAFVGPPWAVVAVADFDGDAQADILWHNSSTGEIQIWFLERERCTARATVLGEDGTPTFIGPPWSIVGAGDFDQDGSADILWHNSSTGEIQIWFMERQHRTARATVLGEDAKPAPIGPPWSIVGVSDANGDANADILWHNSSTGEIQIWFLDREHRTARATVLGEDGKPTFIGPPWSIVATTNSALNLKPDDRWFQVHAETKMHVGSKVSALEGFPGHVDLYATGPDGTVWTTFFQDRIWHPWGQVHPETRMHPGATVSCSKPFDGHVDLYATDSDGIVWTTFFQAGETSFRPWAAIHPETRMASGAEISVLTPFEGHVDLYVTAADGAVWTTFFQAGAPWWTPWAPIHHETKLAPGAPLSVGSDLRSAWVGLAGTATDGTVWTTYFDNDGTFWRPWSPVHPQPKMAPGATVTSSAYAWLATDATGTVWASFDSDNPWQAVRPETTMAPGATISAHNGLAYGVDVNGEVRVTTFHLGQYWEPPSASYWLPWSSFNNQNAMSARGGVTVLEVGLRSNDSYISHTDLYATGRDGAVWTTFFDTAQAPGNHLGDLTQRVSNGDGDKIVDPGLRPGDDSSETGDDGEGSSDS